MSAAQSQSRSTSTPRAAASPQDAGKAAAHELLGAAQAVVDVGEGDLGAAAARERLEVGQREDQGRAVALGA